MPVRAHTVCNPENGLCQDYSAACCNERDCRPIDADRVEAIEGGYSVDGGRFFVPYSKHMFSTDGRYHVCILYEGNERERITTDRGRLCLYTPEPGV